MSIHLDGNHRLGDPLPQNIVLVRSLPGLGDFLCMVPALRALRTALPDAHITLIGLNAAIPLIHRFRHYLNGWLEFPGYPGIPEVNFHPKQTVAFLKDIQTLNFDLAIQMHGSGTHINSFTMLLGAKQTAGFFPSSHTCPDSDRFLPYPEQEPEIWRHLRLLEFLGIPLQGDRLEFPLHQADWQHFQELVSAYSLCEGSYICIHPGASTPERRWAYQQFATVADHFAAQGFQIVLTGSPSEVELTQAVAQAMQFPAINLAGRTLLGTIAALLKRSRLLICNDTGISHLAAALEVNSVVIFTQSDPQRWGPLNRDRHRVVIGNAGEAGLNELSMTAMVLAEAEKLLQQEIIYAS
jgi:ADP-heptose:LPS heptosyltransferase